MHIRLDKISKYFGQFRALDQISLELEAGQIVSLLGGNGAGKSTLLRCLHGLLVPDRGQIRFDDVLFQREQVELRRRIYFLPDFPPLLESTPIEHIALMLKAYGVDSAGAEERILAYMKDFRMLDLGNASTWSLSRGQRYKAALIGLLAVDPEVWLLDEPFASGMDPHGIAAFRAHARAAAGRGRTVLYSTQLLELAETFSDRVCVLHEGAVHAFGTLEALRQARAVSGLEAIFAQLSAAP